MCQVFSDCSKICILIINVKQIQCTMFSGKLQQSFTVLHSVPEHLYKEEIWKTLNRV